MKKQLIITGAILILLTVALSGCNTSTPNPDKPKFLGGTWYGPGHSLTFQEDGSYLTAGIETGTWELKQVGRLELHYTGISDHVIETFVYDYVFSNDNNTLTLTDVDTGGSSVHTKHEY